MKLVKYVQHKTLVSVLYETVSYVIDVTLRACTTDMNY